MGKPPLEGGGGGGGILSSVLSTAGVDVLVGTDVVAVEAAEQRTVVRPARPDRGPVAAVVDHRHCALRQPGPEP